VTPHSDGDLMLRVRRGDLDALDLLFARHHRRLYAFLARLTGDRDAADDLVQDVFLRLLRFRERYREDGQFLPWLFRIARNLAADRYRDRRGSEELSADTAPASDDSAVLDRLIENEDHQQLERALAALPMIHREVLLLRGTERLSHRDLATALNCTEGAARVRVHRALAALRREWHAMAGGTQ
jgi:RNA polymerase sigma factor (sigma-70 family)